MESLQHSGDAKHLEIQTEPNKITFKLAQGSAIIHGHVNQKELKAYAKIAKASVLHVAMKRRLLERNFQLTYCRFSQKNDMISLGIKIQNTTITPQKIFFPLRELALNADFEKEFISSEFDASALLEYDHLTPINPDKLHRYYTTMREWISTTKASLIGLLSNDNKGMASFSYLALLLQIDYLLIPHKKMAKDINEKINTYFLEDEKLTQDKNSDLESYLDELETMSFETFSTQFYSAPITFSPFDQVCTMTLPNLLTNLWPKYVGTKTTISTMLSPPFTAILPFIFSSTTVSTPHCVHYCICMYRSMHRIFLPLRERLPFTIVHENYFKKNLSRTLLMLQ